MAPTEQDKLHKRDTPDPSRTNIIKEDRDPYKDQRGGRYEKGSDYSKTEHKEKSDTKK